MNQYASDLLQFIDACPTAFHAVQQLEKELLEQNYIPLKEHQDWDLKPNANYFVSRAEGALTIFKTPKTIEESSSFQIIGAHTDSPCLKVKSNPISYNEGYQLLNIEVYGGVLLSSWFDKDLYLGGRVMVENDEGAIESNIVQLPFKLRIPRLAIHLDRQVNDAGFKINPQTQMFPILGLEKGLSFEDLLQREIGEKTILSWDLFLFDAERCSFGGVNEEFIFAPRLDNLASVHASKIALLKAQNSATHFQMASYFNHEEIGSVSQNGANSNFLESTLKRIYSAFNKTETDLYKAIAQSFFISADMAHAVHPSYAALHDPNNKPYIGKGPVIKSNANIRYASDAYSIARFKQLCRARKVPYQDFCSRNDVGCGSTIGPMTSAKLGIPTVDIGNPMLSMHSIREMAGAKDHDMLITVFEEFYK